MEGTSQAMAGKWGKSRKKAEWLSRPEWRTVKRPRGLVRMLKNYTSLHSSVQNLHFNRDFPVQDHTQSSSSLPYNTLLLPMKPQANRFSCLRLSLHIRPMGGPDLVTTKHPRCSDIQGYFIHSFLLINELLIISIYVPGPLLGTGDPGWKKKDLIKDPHNNPHI